MTASVRSEILDRYNRPAHFVDRGWIQGRADGRVRCFRLPKNPAELAAAFPHYRQLLLEGGGNVHAAALAVGARRYIQQSSGFYLKARKGKIADEQDTFDIGASPEISLNAQMFCDLEKRTLGDSRMEGVALRYGFFYGPNTWYNPDGGAADQVRQRAIPIIGGGNAVSSFNSYRRCCYCDCRGDHRPKRNLQYRG